MLLPVECISRAQTGLRPFLSIALSIC
jgi:hypothetical protein